MSNHLLSEHYIMKGKKCDKPSIVVGRALLLRIHGNSVTSSILHSGCCRLPFLYLQLHHAPLLKLSLPSNEDNDHDKIYGYDEDIEQSEECIEVHYMNEDDYSYPNPVDPTSDEDYKICSSSKFYNSHSITDVFFIDNNNLAKFENSNSNFTGSLCAYQLLKQDWHICIAISLSQDQFVVCPIANYNIFRQVYTSSFKIEDFLHDPVIIPVESLINKSIQFKFLNQVSGVKPFHNDPPALQFKKVWDMTSTFICQSPSGPDIIDLDQLLSPVNPKIEVWFNTFRKKYKPVPSLFKRSDLYRTKRNPRTSKRRKNVVHPFEYHLATGRRTLQHIQYSCYFDPKYCTNILLGMTNGYFLVPFVVSDNENDVSFAVLDESDLKRLVSKNERTMEDHNRFILEKGRNNIHVPIHYPDSVEGGTCYRKTDNSTLHLKKCMRMGEYSMNGTSPVLAHWFKSSSPQYESMDKDFFINMVGHVYGGTDQTRSLFTKVGTNIYSGMIFF